MDDRIKKKTSKVCVRNKRAHFEYTLLDGYVAGVILVGTEVKSIRLGKVSLQESYCYFHENELWIKGMHIAHYVYGNIQNHVEDRSRKLLLHKKELRKLFKSKTKGMTIVPTELFINERGLVKLRIALARGKKLYDKRQTIKDRDVQRAIRREKY